METKDFNSLNKADFSIENLDVKYKSKQKGTWKNFKSILSSVRLPYFWILLAIATAILTNYFSLLFPKFQEEHFLAGDITKKSIFYGSMIAVLSGGFLVLSSWLNTYTSAKISYRMRNMLWSKVVSLPMKYFDKSNPKELISRVSSDTSQLSSLLVVQLSLFISATYTVVVALTNIKHYSRVLLMISICAIPVQLLIKYLQGYVNFKIKDKLQFRLARITEYIAEILSSIPLLKAFVKENRETERGKTAIVDYNKTLFSFTFFSSIFVSLDTTIALIIQILAIFIGGNLVAGGSLTIPQWISYYIYSKSVVSAVNSFARFWTELKATQGSINRIGALSREEIEKYDGKNIPITGLKDNISFENVDFVYDDGTVALKNCSLEFEKGKTTAVVGVSGSGKSTLLNLIERFYEPSNGVIRVGAYNINEYDLKSYRSRISYISQDVILFSGTLKENLLYNNSNNDVSDSYLIEVLNCVGLNNLVLKYDDVLNLSVDEEGASLSGGERQKIAIARAMIRKSTDILLLDEISSNLDAQSNYEVKCAIKDFASQMTQIVVSHNFATILNANKIIVMNNGTVEASGTHEQLIEQSETYKKLYSIGFCEESELIEKQDDSCEIVDNVQLENIDENVDISCEVRIEENTVGVETELDNEESIGEGGNNE